MTRSFAAYRCAFPAIRRGSRIVLHAGEIALPAGEIIGIVGINGAGKSSLMMHMADVLRTPVLLPHARAVTLPAGYSPQRALAPEWLTCEEFAQLFGLDLDTIGALYPSLRLDEVRGVRGGELSVGQAQALSIALALAGPARLVLLDEPFAPLDFRRRVGLTAILQQLRGSDRTLVMSTQSAAELVDVCSRVVVLKEGRCAWAGSVAALTGPMAGGEAAVRLVEKRLLSMLGDVSDWRTPSACHPQ